MSTDRDLAAYFFGFVTRAGQEKWIASRFHPRMQVVAPRAVLDEPEVDRFTDGLAAMLRDVSVKSTLPLVNSISAFYIPDDEWPAGTGGAVTIPWDDDTTGRTYYQFFPRHNLCCPWLWPHEYCHACVLDYNNDMSLVRDEGFAHVVPLGEEVSLPAFETIVELGLLDPATVDHLERGSDEEVAAKEAISGSGWLMAHLMRRRGASFRDILDLPRADLPKLGALEAHFADMRWMYAVEQGVRLAADPGAVMHPSIVEALRGMDAVSVVEALVPGVRCGEQELSNRFALAIGLGGLVCAALKKGGADTAAMRAALRGKNEICAAWEQVRRGLS